MPPLRCVADAPSSHRSRKRLKVQSSKFKVESEWYLQPGTSDLYGLKSKRGSIETQARYKSRYSRVCIGRWIIAWFGWMIHMSALSGNRGPSAYEPYTYARNLSGVSGMVGA